MADVAPQPIVDTIQAAELTPTPEVVPTPAPAVVSTPEPTPAPVSTAFVDPQYQCDHPTFGRAGTLRIWRFENDHGAAVSRNFSTGELKFTSVRFTGIEVNNYVKDGDEVTLGKEEDITALVLARKAIKVT